MECDGMDRLVWLVVCMYVCKVAGLCEIIEGEQP